MGPTPKERNVTECRSLDDEERAILDSFERGEWMPAANIDRELAIHGECAEETLQDLRMKSDRRKRC